MDFRAYDKLQAQLGGVSDVFLSNTRKVLDASDADPAAKALAAELCTEISRSLADLSRMLSEALIASVN